MLDEIIHIGIADNSDSPYEEANEGHQSPFEAPKSYSGDRKCIKDKQRLIKALEATLGIVQAACKRAKIARSTHYEWVKSDEAYKQDVEDIQELSLDFAETMLFKRIKEGSDQLIKYYLGTKGAKRGYQEKQRVEVGGIDGQPIETNNTLTVNIVSTGLGASKSEKDIQAEVERELNQ